MDCYQSRFRHLIVPQSFGNSGSGGQAVGSPATLHQAQDSSLQVLGRAHGMCLKARPAERIAETTRLSDLDEGEEMPLLAKRVGVLEHSTPVAQAAVGDQDRCELARRMRYQLVEDTGIETGASILIREKDFLHWL